MTFFIYKSFLPVTFHAIGEGKGFVLRLHFWKGHVHVIKGILLGILPLKKLYCTFLKNNKQQYPKTYLFLFFDDHCYRKEASKIQTYMIVTELKWPSVVFYTEPKYSLSVQ